MLASLGSNNTGQMVAEGLKELSFLQMQIPQGLGQFVEKAYERILTYCRDCMEAVWKDKWAGELTTLQDVVHECSLMWPADANFAELMTTLGECLKDEAGRVKWQALVTQAEGLLEPMKEGTMTELQMSEVVAAGRASTGLSGNSEELAILKELFSLACHWALTWMGEKSTEQYLEVMEVVRPWAGSAAHNVFMQVKDIQQLQQALSGLLLEETDMGTIMRQHGEAFKDKISSVMRGLQKLQQWKCDESMDKDVAEVYLKKKKHSEGILANAQADWLAKVAKELEAVLESKKDMAGGKAGGKSWDAELPAKCAWPELVEVAEQSILAMEKNYAVDALQSLHQALNLVSKKEHETIQWLEKNLVPTFFFCFTKKKGT